MPNAPRAIVTGMVVTYPVGGVAWDYLQYALGLEALGFDVHYLEDTGWETYDPARGTYGEDPTYGVGFLAACLSQLSPTLAKRWCFRAMDGTLHGPDAPLMPDLIATADLFLNVSGGTLLRPEYAACRCKVLIDTDPGWNHFVKFPKSDAHPNWLGALGWRKHDLFLTYAERIGKPDCALPTFDLPWKPTRPPVLMGHWSPQPPASTWTTVMTWDNFHKPIEYGGRTYGTKELEFAHVETLPRQVPAVLEVATGGTAPVDRWREIGWSVQDAAAVSATADSYRSYIQQSRGEFSVAKNVYVDTRCGWFSCRSVCYLAAGRPVVVQDTGFSELLVCDEGLLAFTTGDEAAAALRAVEADYDRHSAAARRKAAEYFDSRVVLTDLLQKAGLA